MSKHAPLPIIRPEPKALFDGGPKEPMRDDPVHLVSWAFHVLRFRHLGDQFYDPYLPKHLGVAKKIVTMARGDLQEIKRRISNLWAWSQENHDYYKLTPECLLGKWDDLHHPPTAAVGGRQAMRKHASDAGWDRAKERIRERRHVAEA